MWSRAADQLTDGRSRGPFSDLAGMANPKYRYHAGTLRPGRPSHAEEEPLFWVLSSRFHPTIFEVAPNRSIGEVFDRT